MPFRYTVVPNKKVCFFEPKPLGANQDLQAIRHTMFGAAYLAEGYGLSKLPKTNRCSALWEAGLSS